ncbi:hypothetical protein ACWF95_37460 [Streptomyces vinaceus]
MPWADTAARFLTAQEAMGGLWLFRTLFALSCLVKCGVETLRRYPAAYRPGTWLHYSVGLTWPGRRQPARSLVLAGHTLRWLAAAGLLCGTWPRLCAAVLALVFLAETRIYFRFHVNYFLLLAAILAIAPPLPTLADTVAHLPQGTDATWSYLQGFHGSRLCLVLIALTTSALYMGSAWRKLNRVFLDGTVVWSTLDYTLAQQHQRHYFDAWYPRALPRFLTAVPPGHALWRLTMGAVLIWEAVLPLLLLFPQTREAAVTGGVVMHLGFVFLSPLTLLPFAVVTTAAYLAFPAASPWG